LNKYILGVSWSQVFAIKDNNMTLGIFKLLPISVHIFELEEMETAKINADMKTLLEKQLAIVATSTKDGKPNVGPKGSLYASDDETLVYSEGAARKTLKNIQENPYIAVLVVDREKLDGYQFKGKAELLTQGPIFDEGSETQKKKGRRPPVNIVKIKIEEIYSVKPGMTAERLA
jgi:predicted pyridoxine 5'-phosphate oxidase superfamily flavin-nucleotide-binding protein